MHAGCDIFHNYILLHFNNVCNLQKLKIEVVVPEEKAEIVLKAIADAAKTGEIGDGKIFVTPVDSVVRIRTGDRNETAL